MFMIISESFNIMRKVVKNFTFTSHGDLTKYHQIAACLEISFLVTT